MGFIDCKNGCILFPKLRHFIMIKSNLIDILKTFSPAEMKELRDFAGSSFYNTNPNVVKLFNILRQYHPRYISKNLDKKKIFPKIYAGEKYKDGKMRLLVHYLNEIVEKFLVHKNITADALSYDVLLLNELRERNISNTFEKRVKETYKKLDKIKMKDSGYFINKFYVDIHNLNYHTTLAKYKYDDKDSRHNPEEIFRNLTNFYSQRSFELYEILLTANFLYDYSFKLDIFEKIIAEFDKTKFTDAPEILCRYYLCMMWIDQDDHSNYYELKELAYKLRDKIMPRALNAAFIGLHNFCVRNIRAGNKEFVRELFEIYKKELELECYRLDGYIEHTLFRNAVVVAAALREFEWAKNFIEKYNHELHEDIRESYYLYTYAYCETEIGNFQKALEYLSKLNTDEVYLKLAIKILQCKLYFDLQWQEQLNSLIDASRHFLKNDKILSRTQKQFYTGFFRSVHKLNLLRNSYNLQKLESLKEEINKDENLHGQDWLQAKIAEFENKKGA